MPKSIEPNTEEIRTKGGSREVSIFFHLPSMISVFWEGAMWHAGGANTTEDRRYAVSIDYCAGYLRTQENFLLSLPRERVAAFPEDLKRLVGLSKRTGGLGHVYNHEPDALMQRVAMPATPQDGQGNPRESGR